MAETCEIASVQGRGESRMTESSPVPPASTFVVRFWYEWSVAGPRWRGQIDHVQSGESARFLDLEGMLVVIQSFGVLGGGPGNLTTPTHTKSPYGERVTSRMQKLRLGLICEPRPAENCPVAGVPPMWSGWA